MFIGKGDHRQVSTAHEGERVTDPVGLDRVNVHVGALLWLPIAGLMMAPRLTQMEAMVLCEINHIYEAVPRPEISVRVNRSIRSWLFSMPAGTTISL